MSDRPSGGTYSVPAPREFPSSASTQVERGFPVCAEGFFFALAHPAGVAEGAGGKVSLRQYPGVRLAPGKTFECMEAVYGVANKEKDIATLSAVAETFQGKNLILVTHSSEAAAYADRILTLRDGKLVNGTHDA